MVVIVSGQARTLSSIGGPIYAYISPPGFCFLIVMIVSSFLLVYFSYYVIASYIHFIILYLKESPVLDFEETSPINR